MTHKRIFHRKNQANYKILCEHKTQYNEVLLRAAGVGQNTNVSMQNFACGRSGTMWVFIMVNVTKFKFDLYCLHRHCAVVKSLLWTNQVRKYYIIWANWINYLFHVNTAFRDGHLTKWMPLSIFEHCTFFVNVL